MSEERAFPLFEKTFNKYKKLEREGKLPEELEALPPMSVVTAFDRLRNEKGTPNPEAMTGIFQRVAMLGRG